MLSSGVGWSLCSAHSDPLLDAGWMHHKTGGLCRAAQAGQRAETVSCHRFFLGVICYELWEKVGFGLGCMWIWMDRVEMLFFKKNIFKQAFWTVCLLGECGGVKNEVMDLICGSLWTGVLIWCSREGGKEKEGKEKEEEKKEKERVKPCKHHRKRSTYISLKLGGERRPCYMTLITTQCLWTEMSNSDLLVP